MLAVLVQPNKMINEELIAKCEEGNCLVGKPEGKRLLGIPTGRLEDSTQIYLREIELCGMDWINLVQDRDQWRIS
jgi:hypothetical protein